MAYGKIAGISPINFSPGLETENNTLILTTDNIILFCGNLEATQDINAGYQFCELPYYVQIPYEMVIQVPIASRQKFGIYFIVVTTDGKVVGNGNLSLGDVVFLSAAQINTNGSFYSQELGNGDYTDWSRPREI